MAIGRNWLKTMRAASFRGVPFQVEHDEEDGGRRIVSHEFPMRDAPFNEDLGEAKREFEVTAYLASDDVEKRAAALSAACAKRGAATLVLPSHGSITVRCLTFKRAREKDKTGKIAYSLKYVREGAATALISFSSLANLIFVAADTIQNTIATFTATAISYVAQAEYVLQATNNVLADGAAMLETVRTTANVDPIVSATQRREIQALYDAAPEAVTRSGGVAGDQFAQLVTIARALGDGLPGSIAIAAFAPLIEAATYTPPAAFPTRNAMAHSGNVAVGSLVIQIAAAAAYSEGIARAEIADRPQAITLRADTVEYFDLILNALSSENMEIHSAVMALRGSVVEYLSRTILDRAPVITVGSNLSMPSLFWAHRLYQDPTRSTDLTDRNSVPYPALMPLDFEALAY